MALIVVKENQTVRGVKMSEQLTNIIKILLVTFILLFHGMRIHSEKQQPYNYLSMVKESPFPTVSITECPHKVKLSIRNNETGEIVEGEIVTPQT